MGRLRCVAVSLALLAPALLSREAAAENGVKPRMPVTWDAQPACLEYVDRSVNPVYSFEYSIKDEDPSPGEELLPDEVEDSRRHQFFAFSRQGNVQTDFPYNWVSPADVQAAVDRGLILPTLVGEDETLDTSPRWVDRFVRITPDDARRLITNKNADTPVQWDTSDAPAGAYMLWGYTWEPAFNRWWQRVGNVVVVHDGDPAALGPAAAITSEEIIVYSDETAQIEGCVHAIPGTTVTGYFSLTPQSGDNSDWQPEWVQFAEDVPVEGDTFAIDIMPGEAYATERLLVYLEFTDPQGRSSEAHMPFLISVLAGMGAGCDTEGGGFIGMPGCGGDDGTDGSDSDPGSDTENGSSDSDPSSTTAGTASASASAGSTGPSSPGGSGDGGSGGSCAVQTDGAPTAGLLLLTLLGLRRRRA